MDLELAGRVAIVSGGSKGIGRVIVDLLAAEGVRVGVVARGADAVHSVVEEVTSDGREALAVIADMTDAGDISRAVAEVRAAFGAVDIAISNVYPVHRATLDDATDEDFTREFESMVLSVVRLARAVTPAMRKRHFGRLINIGSVTMKGPTFGFPMILSNVVRPAVVGLDKALSHELAADGITVNNIAVGSVKTERARDSFQARTRRTAATFDDLERERVAELAIPAQRMGDPREVAALAVFLASPLAGYVTGQTIAVDGGRSGGLF